jgi:hypothetical protein
VLESCEVENKLWDILSSYILYIPHLLITCCWKEEKNLDRIVTIVVVLDCVLLENCFC